MTGHTTRVGSMAWADLTGGTLSGAEKRQLLAPLAPTPSTLSAALRWPCACTPDVEPRCRSGHCARRRRH